MVVYKNLVLFCYNIEIIFVDIRVKRVPIGKKAKKIIKLLIKKYFSKYKNSITTNYKSNLIYRSKLSIDEKRYLVWYRLKDEDKPSQNTKAYKLHLQSTNTLVVSKLRDYLTSSYTNTLFRSKDKISQVLNIVIEHYPKSASNIFSIDANKHFELVSAAFEIMSLGGELQTIRGFFISIRSATCRILLNV